MDQYQTPKETTIVKPTVITPGRLQEQTAQAAQEDSDENPFANLIDDHCFYVHKFCVPGGNQRAFEQTQKPNVSSQRQKPNVFYLKLHLRP